MNLEQLKQKSYRDLSETEKKYLKEIGILNGAGPQIKPEYTLSSKIWLYILRFCLKYLFNSFRQTDFDFHDFGYWVGGNEARRLECDSKLLYFMSEDVKNKFQYILVILCYIAIRIGGKAYFNYTKLNLID